MKTARPTTTACSGRRCAPPLVLSVGRTNVRVRCDYPILPIVRPPFRMGDRDDHDFFVGDEVDNLIGEPMDQHAPSAGLWIERADVRLGFNERCCFCHPIEEVSAQSGSLFLLPEYGSSELFASGRKVPNAEAHLPRMSRSIRRLASSQDSSSEEPELATLFDSEAGIPWGVAVAREARWLVVAIGPPFAPGEADVDIWRMGLDGADATNLTADLPGNHALPHVSAGGGRIVFRTGGDGGGRVYAMGPDGAGRRRLTAEDAIETMPALTSDRGGYNDEWPLTPWPQPYGDLWAVPVASGPAVRLTHNKWEDGPCDWGDQRVVR